MKTKISIIIAFAITLCLAGCKTGPKITSETAADIAAITDSSALISPTYAKGFTVQYLEDGIRLVDIQDPQAEEEDKMPVGYQFALIPKGLDSSIYQEFVPEGYTVVKVPVTKTIAMTLLQLSNFTALDAHDCLSAITTTKNLFNKDILARVEDGRLQKIGHEGNFDQEMIMAANPEVIFISPFKKGGYDAIKETGITLVPHLGYKELTPLGQAEWIKFISMFIGKEKTANETFSQIEKNYMDMKALAENTQTRPTVFSGEMHSGNWYAVGGKNHLAQIFRDAGADYLIKDDNTGGVNIEFEKVYATCAKADYWRILNSFSGDFSYDALKKSEPRNALFDAFKNKKVIYCNMKQTPYYELAPVHPDLLLKDFIAILHPELVEENYEPTFYRILK
ncbi:MAG: ABC transporter substrate-binding protein [Bacteroidales bacterium]|nr:ABC transporter substrate-binding protein [Bacteroidales bacterium]